jgi:transcriptional enhancer factor
MVTASLVSWYIAYFANKPQALIDIPAMGRRKFSYKGKPHGRNELIKEYIWIAYLQSLPPGQRPDPSMARDRKQVSSHIQVLKGFLKDHPACKI